MALTVFAEKDEYGNTKFRAETDSVDSEGNKDEGESDHFCHKCNKTILSGYLCKETKRVLCRKCELEEARCPHFELSRSIFDISPKNLPIEHHHIRWHK
jgi:hypothetical protein